MTTIFISHSKNDIDILNAFDKLFAGTTVKAIRAEYEEMQNTPAMQIMAWIEESSSVFVLLGPNIANTEQTKYWVGWETGFASKKKSIWVFEPFDSQFDIPVPYLNHYILYNPNDKQHLNYIKNLIEKHDKNPELAAAALGALIGAELGSGPGAVIGGLIGLLAAQNNKLPLITCPYPNCRASFYLHSNANQFKCPTCRKGMQLN